MSRPKPFPGGKIQSRTTHKINLTAEQEQWLRDYFPTWRGDTLREMMGVGLSTFYNLVKKLGLKKTDAMRARIYRANAAKGKKKCEANGYYDSIRGKRLSQQAIDGVHAMWQRIRCGEELHPMIKIKNKHPRRYKKICEERSKKRKMLIKMEKLRLMSGLKQATKLTCIYLQPFTGSQKSHRYNALKRGYWFYEAGSEQDAERYNIYYDEGTTRSEKFEANLRADGFNVQYKAME